MENSELIQEINKNTALALPGEITLEELQLRLAAYINELIQADFQKLIGLLYRIDVSEQKLKQLLKQLPGEAAGDIIAELIIERQLQKIATRKQFRRRDDDAEPAEKW